MMPAPPPHPAAEAQRTPGAACRILIAAGGTGGHVYPGIALARCFQARCPGTEVAFLGRQGGLEERLIPREGFPLHLVQVQALKGRSKRQQVAAIIALMRGTWQALRLMQRWRPHLVVGAGGYVMGPAILAATILRVPRVVMEQNVIPGMTVRTMARYAQRVFTAFAESATYLAGRPVQCTGTPIRQDIGAVAAMPPDGDSRVHLLIFGGSQGAHRINQAAIDMLPQLKTHQQQLALVHQTGEADCAAVQQAYAQHGMQAEVVPFLHDMARRYHWAHVIVCRAGASTLAELTACGKPALLVPYPYAADNHQWHNAMALQRQGAARVIPDAELTGERLYAEIQALLLHPEHLQQHAAHSQKLARPEAAEAIVTACIHLLRARSSSKEAL